MDRSEINLALAKFADANMRPSAILALSALIDATNDRELSLAAKLLRQESLRRAS